MGKKVSDEMIDVTTAMRHSGFSRQWIYHLCAEGMVKAQRVSHGWHHRWEIELASLLAYMKRMEELGTDKHSPT